MNRFPLRSLAVALLLASGSLAAAPLDAALDESQRLAAEAKASQGRVEQPVRSQWRGDAAVLSPAKDGKGKEAMSPL